MGVDLKQGKITSYVGDMAVVSPADLKCVLSLNLARRLYGKTTSVDKLKMGKIFDIIGRVDRPYLVVRLSKNLSNPETFIGKTLHIK